MDLSLYNGWNDIKINLCPRDIGFNLLMAAVDERSTALYNWLYQYPIKRLKPLANPQNNLRLIEAYINALIPKFLNPDTVTNNPEDFENWELWTKESIYDYIGEECIDPLINNHFKYKYYPIEYFEQKKKILNLLMWTKESYTEDVLFNLANGWAGGNSWEHISSVADAYSNAVSNIVSGVTNYGSQGIYAVSRAYHGKDYNENDTYEVSVFGTELIGINYLLPVRLLPPVDETYQQSKYNIDIYYKFEIPDAVWGQGFEDTTFDGGGRFIEGWNLIDTIDPLNCFDAEKYKWTLNTQNYLPSCPATPDLNEYTVNGYQALQGGFVKKFDVDGGFKFRAED